MKKKIFVTATIHLIICLFTILYCCIPDAAAEPPEVVKAPAPKWIVSHARVTASDIPSGEIQDGEYYLHVDKQIRVENSRLTQYFNHFAIHIVNESGLETASQISILFDPEYQKAVFHQLLIHRNNQIIDKLSDTKIELMRREENMESLIYDGRYTANLIVEDVRVGDVIEYAYSIIGDNPIYNGLFSYKLRVSWSVPVKHPIFILHWPGNRTLHQKGL